MIVAESRAQVDASASRGRVDPRVRRTRSQLMAALVDLASDRDLDDITVGELTAAAGLNRATFYLHYASKEQVLVDVIDGVIDELSTGADAASGEELDDPHLAPRHTQAFFAELDERAALYRRILGATGSPAVVARLAEGLQRVVADQIGHRAPGGALDTRSIERRAAFVAGGVIAAAVTWIGRDDRTPAGEEAAEVWRLALAAVAPRPS
jgi:AcrR family transcriptional regulator